MLMIYISLARFSLYLLIIHIQKLTEFLLSQKTIEALQFALTMSPMNKNIMGQLGELLIKKAADLNTNEKMRLFYQTRGEWYIKSSQ